MPFFKSRGNGSLKNRASYLKSHLRQFFRTLHSVVLALNPFDPALTSTPISQQVAVDILDVGVDSGPTRDTAGGHVRVSLGVDILEALPRHTRAEL